MVKKSVDALAYERGLFRYSIVAELLSRPPEVGDLAKRLQEISKKSFVQTWNKKEIKISIRTLERWYAAARKAQRPSEILQPRLRIDRGTSRVLTEEHKSWLADYRLQFPSWSIQLLFDNMVAAALKSNEPSYSTVLRYFKRQGFWGYRSPGKGRNAKEVRSYEVEFVGQMWHMDFHKGNRKVVTEDGEFQQPICMAIIDDKSRLVCHAQWFLNETAEVLVHGLTQAILKRGLPRTFYSDNGSAMKAEEFKAGLDALNIKIENTLPYAPYQNGKQEAFWQPLEGRLIKMLPAEKRLTLEVLNIVTQAWIEQDYHIKIHSETGEKPLDRFFNCSHVLRDSPAYDDLKCNFRMHVTRTVRKTDSTVTLDGVRFQVPQCYTHMDSLFLRYARWDLGEAEILCPDSYKSLCVIIPLDKLANSSGIRKSIRTDTQEDIPNTSADDTFLDLNTDQLPPLLANCLRKHAQQYPLGGYIPIQTKEDQTDEK
jgi:putative transposase